MNEFDILTRQAERIKNLYPEGTRLELIRMKDPYHPVASGMRGTVEFVDDIGQIQVRWDNGSGLALIPNHDEFKKLSKGEMSQEYVDNLFRYYRNKDFSKAWEEWNKLFDLYDTPSDAPDTQRISDSNQLRIYLAKIDIEIICAVTDYGREKIYHQKGFYIEKSKSEPDICD